MFRQFSGTKDSCLTQRRLLNRTGSSNIEGTLVLLTFSGALEDIMEFCDILAGSRMCLLLIDFFGKI